MDTSREQKNSDPSAPMTQSVQQPRPADKDPSAASNIDTVLGRIVVEQGLASSSDVEKCFEAQRQRGRTDNESSLGGLLLQHEIITRRQLERLLKEIEAQRSTQQIPGYSIKKKVGAGAMASVYLARQISLDRMVAIKVLPQKHSSNASFIQRFYKEGRAAAKLNHPNIVQAYDVGRAGDFHYFVMEYVEGGTVHDILLKKGKIAEDDAINIILQVADALNHAHKQGFVHRDVKPKNIMFNRAGVAKLADMGLARAVSDSEAAQEEKGRAFGTPYYISPEQIRGEVDVGPQADIYSLGAMFYHMVTGQVPFEGENPTAVMHKHLKGELTPPDHVNPKLSGGVSEIIEMAMAKSRRERYQNCADLIEDLKLVQSGSNPRFAHKEMNLSGLATGAALHPDDPQHQSNSDSYDAAPSRSTAPNTQPLLILLGVLLGLSVMANLVLLVVALG